MAITQPYQYNENGPLLNQIATYDYAIGGKLVVATIRLTQDRFLLMEDDAKDHIKKTLVTMIVEKMIQDGLVEFTQAEDHATMMKVVRARAYAAPDSQVKILRSLTKL